MVEVELRAVGDLGDHVTGTAVLDLPRRNDGDAVAAATTTTTTTTTAGGTP